MIKLIYIFDSYRNKEKLKKSFPHVVVIKNIKQGIKIVQENIIKLKPDLIIGIARSRVNYIEPCAVNRFNKIKKVSSNGISRYDLEFITLKSIRLIVRNNPTTSFCNYFAYKLAEFISINKVSGTKNVFLHLNDNSSFASKLILELVKL